MNELLAHTGSGGGVRGFGDYVGSPLYGIIPEHVAALFTVGMLFVGSWAISVFARRGHERSAAIVARYRALDPRRRFVLWLVLIAGFVHVGLVIGHEPGGYTVAYAIGSAAELYAAWLVLRGGRWRLVTGLALTGSLLAFTVSNISGAPPDQVGMATKLVELPALGVALRPARGGRLRSVLASGGLLVTMVIVAFGAWAGAFIGVDGSHHLGEAAQPGTLIPDGVDRPPTSHELAEANELFYATLATANKYRDPAAAAADGYNVDGIFGNDFHAVNEAYKTDGRVFDPDRPENLIYAMTDQGPQILGVMYEMEEIGEAGPAIGGPLTVWHAHDHVCFSLMPLALAGLTDPYGVCPLGSVTIPITNEMIHVWTMPGAPERIGHIEDEWLEGYLAQFND